MAPAPRGAVYLLLLAAALICAPLLLQLKLGLGLSQSFNNSELKSAQSLVSKINLRFLQADNSIKQLEARRKQLVEESSREEPSQEQGRQEQSNDDLESHSAPDALVASTPAPNIIKQPAPSRAETPVPVDASGAGNSGTGDIKKKPHCTINLHVDTKAVGDAESWLEHVFEGLDGRVGSKEIEKIRATGAKYGGQVEGSCAEDTYGEITAKGLQTLLQHEKMLPSKGIFFDLGAGTGRAVVNTALHSGFSEVYGIEISEERYKQACEGFQRLSSSIRESQKPGVKVAKADDKDSVYALMALGDVTKTDISRANVIYVASVCFRPSLLEAVVAHFCKELRPGVRIASARPLKDDFSLEGQKHKCDGPRKIVKTATLMVGMTWGASFVHVYEME